MEGSEVVVKDLSRTRGSQRYLTSADERTGSNRTGGDITEFILLDFGTEMKRSTMCDRAHNSPLYSILRGSTHACRTVCVCLCMYVISLQQYGYLNVCHVFVCAGVFIRMKMFVCV